MNFEEWKEQMIAQRNGNTSEIYNADAVVGKNKDNMNNPEYGQLCTITYNITGNLDISNWPIAVNSGRTLVLNIEVPYGAICTATASENYTFENNTLTVKNIQNNVEITVNLGDVLYDNAKIGDYLYSDWTFGPNEKDGYFGRCVGTSDMFTDGKSRWCSKNMAPAGLLYWGRTDVDTSINNCSSKEEAAADFAGQVNTKILVDLNGGPVSVSSTYKAAGWASEQFEHFGYLPSVGELLLCRNAIKDLIYSGLLWSSTEASESSTWEVATNSESYSKINKQSSVSALSFVSLKGEVVKPKINGHDYVYIGGLRWSPVNIGATDVTDYGLYFLWADIEGYTAQLVGDGEGQKDFSFKDYKYYERLSETQPLDANLTKYNNSDLKKILDPEDDAAHVLWEDDWRIPTLLDFSNLFQNTNQEYILNYNDSGVDGWLFTDKSDATKIIFFPTCGECDGIYPPDPDESNSDYWFNSRANSSPCLGNIIDLSTSINIYSVYRFLGLPIRPVAR